MSTHQTFRFRSQVEIEKIWSSRIAKHSPVTSEAKVLFMGAVRVEIQEPSQPSRLVGPGTRVGPVGPRGIFTFNELPVLSKSCRRTWSKWTICVVEGTVSSDLISRCLKAKWINPVTNPNPRFISHATLLSWKFTTNYNHWIIWAFLDRKYLAPKTSFIQSLNCYYPTHFIFMNVATAHLEILAYAKYISRSWKQNLCNSDPGK
jgi:hypothetical protein